HRCFRQPNRDAENSDGWTTYPRDPASQGRAVADYRARVAAANLPNKPVMQSLYVDLQPEPEAKPRPIHLGFSSGTDFLRQYLVEVRELGVNHVALNLRFNGDDVEDTMKRIADDLLPEFSL
ncbi:MAG: LLM class flavin-dependent oxidoreductase, partial [Pseudomonadota bacterium]